GGSITSDACLVGFPRSVQYEGGPIPTRASLGARSSLSAAAALWACATRCLYSSSFRLVRSPRFLLRCMGTPILPGQMPCMSGSPHGVLGAVQLLPWFL